MSGDESGGPAERNENTLADRQPAGEARPPGGNATGPPGEGTAATTVTDEPLETETTVEAGPSGDADPWPDLAQVTEEEPSDAGGGSSALEPDADGETPPQLGATSPGSDRRVAPQPPAMGEIPVAMAASAFRAEPAESTYEAPPPPYSAPPLPLPPQLPPQLAPQLPPPPMVVPGPAMEMPQGGAPQSLGSNALPYRTPPGSGTRPKILIGVAAGLAVVVIGALAAVLLWATESGRSGTAAPAPPKGTAPATSTDPSAAPSGPPGAGTAPTAPGTPGPGAGQTPAQPSGPVTAPPAGPPGGTPAVPPQMTGTAVHYQTVQQDPGYFEGVLTFTNQTGSVIHAWEVSFTYPGANVKNIWDAVLVRGGDRPVIRSMQSAEAIPPGGSLEVRFGAEGIPSAPRDCLFGGRACEFA